MQHPRDIAIMYCFSVMDGQSKVCYDVHVTEMWALGVTVVH